MPGAVYFWCVFEKKLHFHIWNTSQNLRRKLFHIWNTSAHKRGILFTLRKCLKNMRRHHFHIWKYMVCVPNCSFTQSIFTIFVAQDYFHIWICLVALCFTSFSYMKLYIGISAETSFMYETDYKPIDLHHFHVWKCFARNVQQRFSYMKMLCSGRKSAFAYMNKPLPPVNYSKSSSMMTLPDISEILDRLRIIP